MTREKLNIRRLSGVLSTEPEQNLTTQEKLNARNNAEAFWTGGGILTGDIDFQIGGINNVNYLKFSTNPIGIPNTQGTMSWNQDNQTIQAVLNGYTMQIGEDTFYPVKNQTGTSIPKGTVVRFAGTLGSSGRLLIAPFIADGSVSSSFFMGVTAEVISDGADGKVLWFGKLRGINTNSYNEGDILYASPTVAGGFTTTPPQAPNNIVQIAAVITKSTTVGEIFIRPQLGSNIKNDEGVKLTTPQTGDILQLQSNGLFENRTKAQYLGGNSTQFVKGDGTLDSNTYQLLSQKGQINGYASLDGTGRVPASQLPSYVDDVLEFANFASFPATGETGKIYVALDTNKTYRWSGSAYIEISPSDVNSVFGRTGNVTAQSTDYNNFYVRHDINTQGLTTQQQLNARTNIGSQQLLISGTNIKTINNQTLLGSGNIEIIQTVDQYTIPIYTHTQSTASTTWTITHNLNSLYPVITVYDNSNKVVIPKEITIVNANSVTVEFFQSVSGYATIIGGSAMSLAPSLSTTQNLGNISGNVTINLANGDIIIATLTNAVTLSFTGLPTTGRELAFTLRFAGIHQINLPIGTRFPNGTAPTPSGVLYELPCSINNAGQLIVYGSINDIRTP